MYAVTVRPLTHAERARLTARRQALEARIDEVVRRRRTHEREARAAVLWIAALFGVLTVFDLSVGAVPAALVSAIGTVGFAAIAVWVGSDSGSVTPEDRARLDLDAALAGEVRVTEIASDAAVPVRDPADPVRVYGDLLRVGERSWVYLRRDGLPVPPELLPARRLRLDVLPGIAVFAAAVHGSCPTPWGERVIAEDELLGPLRAPGVPFMADVDAFGIHDG
ncbi:MAG: hypothetical protein ABMB14_00705 [Myxococcota bacterium]